MIKHSMTMAAQWAVITAASGFAADISVVHLGMPENFRWLLFSLAAITGLVAKLYLRWPGLRRAVLGSVIGLSIAIWGTLPLLRFSGLAIEFMPVVAFSLAWGWEILLSMIPGIAKKWGGK